MSDGVPLDGPTADDVRNDAHGEDTPSTALANVAKGTGGENDATQSAPRPGGLLSVVARWNPRATPKFTITAILYLLGLFIAFGARPPVVITDEMQVSYFEKMEFADSIDYEPRMAAESALHRASMNTRRANRFMCSWNENCRTKVKGLKQIEKKLWNEAEVYRAKRKALIKDAKSSLGLWSSLGIDETKSLFRKAYESGKVYATRTSYYDTFWLILYGRSDDSMVELLIRWGFQVLMNFTAGMMRAVFSFAWSLPSVISDYGASTLSAISFFIVAVIAAMSVAFSLLLLLFGTAGGVTYGVVAAAPALARLEQNQRQQERQRLLREHQRRRGGFGGRPHED